MKRDYPSGQKDTSGLQLPSAILATRLLSVSSTRVPFSLGGRVSVLAQEDIIDNVGLAHRFGNYVSAGVRLVSLRECLGFQ